MISGASSTSVSIPTARRLENEIYMRVLVGHTGFAKLRVDYLTFQLTRGRLDGLECYINIRHACLCLEKLMHMTTAENKIHAVH